MRADWIEIELGDVLKLKNGYAFKSSQYQDTGIPIIRISDIKQGIVKCENAKKIEDLHEYDNYQIEFGDILIAMSGATTGKFGIYKQNQKAYQNQRVGKFELHSDKFLDKLYIYYLLFSLKNKIEKDAYGGAQPNISGKKIEKMYFSLAPLPEQRAIVAKIEKLFSDLDNGIANFKEAKDKLGIYRHAVLKKAFEGELTKEWRKSKGYSFQTWKLIKLGEIAEIKRGKSKHRPRNDPKLFGGNYPFIQTGDVKAACGGRIMKYSQTYNETGLAQSQLWPAGTLCLTIAANIADTAFLGLDACFPDSVVGIKSECNILSLQYLNYLIQKLKVEIDSNASATAQKNINVAILNNLKIPLPTIEEQNVIVEDIESRLTVCEKLTESIDQGIEQAEALRQSLLKKAFSGELLSDEELEACRKEPDWEPADKLLERIKKEKSELSGKKRKK